MPHRGEDEEADEHPGGAGHEGLAAAVVLDDVEAVEGGAEIDAVKYHLGDVAVVDADGLENGRAVVEEVVGARQLLKHLKTNAEGDSVGHPRSGEQLLYLLEPRITGGFGGELDANFFELVMYSPVVVGDPVDFCHGSLGLIDAAMAIGVARCFRKQKDTKAKDNGPEEPDTQGNTPGATVPTRFGAIVDAAGQEDTKRDEKLIGALNAVSVAWYRNKGPVIAYLMRAPRI